MAHVIVSNNSRDLWSEVKKVKGRNSKISSNVDGSCDSKEITELFSESINIYITLYHIILMICMLLKVQYLNDYITVKMLNMLYLIVML